MSDHEDDMDDGIDYWKEFQAGTRAVFYKWAAMRMAVDNGWGGRNSAEKEEELILDIIDLLDRKPDVDKLLDLIDAAVIDGFHMILDDNSPEEVGLDIWDMYCDCGEGDTASARKVLESLPTEKQREITDIVGLTEPETRPIVESKKEESQNSDAMVDDDGWQVVTKPSKKKKNKNPTE